MRCPRCSHPDSRVVESRTLAEGRAVRRRRECLNCEYRFTSYERIDEKPLMVVKRHGNRREPWDRTKVETGVRQALRKRPISQTQIEALVDELEDAALQAGMESHEITSTQVGEMVLERLRAIDDVAYVRFASVYRAFDDLDEFVAEIRQLSRGASSSQKKRTHTAPQK